MNKNQRKLFKALEIIANSTIALSDIQNIVTKLSKDQLQEVIDNFSDKVTDFDIKDLFEEAYNYETNANSILIDIEEKLGVED